MLLTDFSVPKISMNNIKVTEKAYSGAYIVTVLNFFLKNSSYYIPLQAIIQIFNGFEFYHL
jgi:hypothetical protein